MKKKVIIYILSLFLSNLCIAQLPILKVGAEKGVASISGEVEPATGFALGFFLEKPIVPSFSLRLHGAMGNMRGQDLNPSQNWVNHPSWNGTLNPLADYNTADVNFIFANYKTDFLEASLQGKLMFTQWPFWNNQSKFDAFLFAGIGLMQFETKVDVLSNNQMIYDFSNMPINPTTSVETLASLQQLQNGKYETGTQAGQQTTPLYEIGAGIEWQVHPSISLALNYRYAWTNTDVLDSYQWNENNAIDSRNDAQHYTSIGIIYQLFKQKEVDEKPIPVEVPVQPTEIQTQPKVDIPIIEVPADPIVVPQTEEVKIVELNVRDSIVVRRAFDNLEFETDQAIIRSVSYLPLNELAALLREHPSWKLKISGHTDNTGDPAFNMDLSKRRAEAVRDYLYNLEVALDRFVVEYFGQTQPIASNNDRAGRQKNRRVELLIIE